MLKKPWVLQAWLHYFCDKNNSWSCAPRGKLPGTDNQHLPRLKANMGNVTILVIQNCVSSYVWSLVLNYTYRHSSSNSWKIISPAVMFSSRKFLMMKMCRPILWYSHEDGSHFFVDFCAFMSFLSPPVFWTNMVHMTCVKYHMSHVKCHLLPVTKANSHSHRPSSC